MSVGQVAQNKLVDYSGQVMTAVLCLVKREGASDEYQYSSGQEFAAAQVVHAESSEIAIQLNRYINPILCCQYNSLD